MASAPVCRRVWRKSRAAAIAAITRQPMSASHGASRSEGAEIAAPR